MERNRTWTHTWQLFTILLVCNGANAEPVYKDVFVSGTEGYHTFRIPALLTTPKGSLLAFCEGKFGVAVCAKSYTTVRLPITAKVTSGN